MILAYYEVYILLLETSGLTSLLGMKLGKQHCGSQIGLFIPPVSY